MLSTPPVSPPRHLLLVCPESLRAAESRLACSLDGLALTMAVLAPERAGAAPPGARVIGVSALRALPTPDWVLFASPPTAALAGRVWWWQRRRAPGALLGVGWRADAPGGWGSALVRAGADFWLAEDAAGAADLARRGVPTGRVWLAGGAETLPAFLERRRRAEERSVLWVDDDLSLKSPSTKHLVSSIPHLQAAGWDLRGWCLSADAAARAGAEVRAFPPAPRALRLFTPYWFFALVNLHGLGQWLLKGRSPARVVHTVGGAYLGVDLVSVQFVNHVWFHRQIELGLRGLKDWAMLALTALGTAKDQLQFSNGRVRTFLPASDSIGTEVRRRCRRRAMVRTLANSYDETRFNPAVRAGWREPMRRELGFGAGDTVFVFASQGHYKRKGFWLAAEALARLRRRADVPGAAGVRFLVVGGQPGTLARLQAELAGPYPDWREWLVFAGSQPAVERYLSAADAFLFPSYFEAFCLAEIEAGALGLPLLLTPHHGTEMILQDGVNGLRLPFDAGGIEASLAGFMARGLPPFAPGAGRALDRPAYARELAAVYEEYAGRANQPASG